MKYKSNYKIKSVKFTYKGKEYDIEGSKVLSGIYEYEKGGKLDKYTYISKRNVKEFVTENGSVKDHLNGVWVLSSALKSAPKKVTNIPKNRVAKAGALIPPSEKFKGKKNMPVQAFEVAEEMVAMKKAKAKISAIRSKQNILSKELRDNKSFKEWHEPLAYTVLWYNSNMPKSLTLNVLQEEYYGEGLTEAYKEEFKKAPDLSKKVAKLKKGNFMSNKAEQKLSKSFTGTDDLRPQLMDTYIDNGYAVSTNAHILLGIYDETLKGKAEFLNDPKTSSNYVNWRQVLPSVYSIKTKKINAQRLYDFLLKVSKYSAYDPVIRGVIIKIDDNNSFGFNTYLLTQSLTAIMSLGEDVYMHYVDTATSRAVIFTNIENWDLDKKNSSFALTMPIMTINNGLYLTYDLNGSTFFAKGGKLGFDNLSKRIAKDYEGKEVKPKYQKEYGKRYSPKEAKEVGKKIAYSVMQMQNKKMQDGGALEYSVFYKKGGETDRKISIVNEGVIFDKDKYKTVFGDFDNDGVLNIDDANPLKKTKQEMVEQVELSKTFDKLLDTKKKLDGTMDDAVDLLDKKAPKGADIYARTKTPYSILKKLVEKRMLDPKKGLTDMVGTTIAVGNQKELEKVRDDIDAGMLGKILDRDDYYKNPKAGYRAYHYIVEYKGVPIEVQLKTKSMKKLNEVSHEFYKDGSLNASGLESVSKLFEKADRGDAEVKKEVASLLKDSKKLASMLTKTDSKAKGGKVAKKRNSGSNGFFGTVKKRQKSGEKWADAVQRVKLELSKEKN